MRLGLGLGINRLQRPTGGAPPAFTPASLFTGTDAGFWSDVIAPSRLWRDTGRTTPVTATGQDVAAWELRTRTGVIYAQQPSAGNRFTYEVDGNGFGFLLGNGTSTFMDTPAITGGPDYQAFAAVHPLSIAATSNIIDADYIGTRRWGQFLRIVAGGAPESIAFSGTTPVTDGAATVSAGANVVLSGIARSAQSVDVRRDGVSNGATTTGLTLNTMTEAVRIGNFAGPASAHFNGRIYGVVLRFGPNLTTTQITDTEAWLAALMNP
jgi:hypothetical protein